MKSELKPIRSEADYDEALAEVEHLWGAKLGTPEGDRLDILATLIEAYEDKHYPMDPPDPIEAIKYRMEQQGLTRKDLEPMIGTRTRVAEVLNGKRNLVDHDDPQLACEARYFGGGADPAATKAAAGP